jgi:hypothetical protein
MPTLRPDNGDPGSDFSLRLVSRNDFRTGPADFEKVDLDQLK